MRSRRTQFQAKPEAEATSPSAADPDTGRTEPVVTYSRLPSEAEESLDAEGRVEPRLGVLPIERDSRTPTSRVEARRIEAVRADVRSIASNAPRVPVGDRRVGDLAVDDLVDAPAAAEANAGRARAEVPSRRRGRGSRLALLVGLIALFGGAGVLAATFSGVLYSDGDVTRIAAPGETAADKGAPVAVDGGVRMIGGSIGVAPAGVTLPADTTTPAVAALDPATGDAASKAIDPPPLPRLRPTQAVEASAPAAAPEAVATLPPATSEAPAVLPPPVLTPPVLAPGPRNLGTLTVAPGSRAPTAANAGNDIDADALMDDVDRLLAERRAAQGTAPADGAPLLAPAPSSETVAYPPGAYPPNSYPAASAYPPATYPPNTYPPAYPPAAYPGDSGLASAEPPPPPVRSRYRNILPDDEILPTPPANVPQGGVY